MKKFLIMLTALAATVPAAPQIAAASTGAADTAQMNMHTQTRTVTRTSTTVRNDGRVVRRTVVRRGGNWNRGRHYGWRNRARTVCTMQWRNHHRVRVCRTMRWR